jgi:hypothetical protein
MKDFNKLKRVKKLEEKEKNDQIDGKIYAITYTNVSPLFLKIYFPIKRKIIFDPQSTNSYLQNILF